MKCLKLGKASGHDEISHHMLTFSADSLTKPLTKLFNISLSTNTFPSL